MRADQTQRERGTAISAILMVIVLVLLVVSTVYIFVANIWPMPPAITAVGHWIDQQYKLTLWITGVVFVLAQLGLALFVWQYRDRGQAVRFTHGNTVLEVLWTTTTFVLFIGLGVMAVRAWARVHFVSAAPGALQVQVMAEQFTWTFRYPGPDGKFAPTAPQYYASSSGNPFGIVPDSPDKDDVISGVLVVPVDREVELLLQSKDVVHDFFVRELRIKQDVVPGMVIPIHFTPRQVGTYEIVCAQLCGLGHNHMHSYLRVVTEAEFEQWLREQQQSAAP